MASGIFVQDDAALVRGNRALGDFDLTFCSDGTFLLDGGAMFGVVPKPMWSKRLVPDENNSIVMGTNSLIVRTGNAVVAIEMGIGNKLPQKLRDVFQNQQRLPASLAAAGVRAEDVTHVVNTHLHFDHSGWNTTLHTDGTVRPTFPNARYFASAGELAHGRLQIDRDKVSYLGPNYDPVIASGQMTLIDLDGRDGYTPADPRLAAQRLAAPEPLPPVPIQTTPEIAPGVWVECFPGHTATMLAVHIESGGQHACFCGDLIPTHAHLDPTWVMAYDLDPVTTIAEKKRLYARAIPEQWMLIFPHDHRVPATYIEWNDKGKPVVAKE